MKEQNNTAYRVALFGCLLGAALILGYVELLIPIQIPIQGVKLGLANAAVLLMLYLADAPSAFLLSILRIFLSGFLFSNMAGIIYSLSGGMLSLAVMALLKKAGVFSVIGVSMAGAVAHNAGQLAVACAVLGSGKIFLFYGPVLLIAGILTGTLIGILTKELLPRLTLRNRGGKV